MDKDFLKNMVTDTMNVYKTAFEEGRKSGFQEGYVAGLSEAQKIVDKTLGDKK